MDVLGSFIVGALGGVGVRHRDERWWIEDEAIRHRGSSDFIDEGSRMTNELDIEEGRGLVDSASTDEGLETEDTVYERMYVPGRVMYFRKERVVVDDNIVAPVSPVDEEDVLDDIIDSERASGSLLEAIQENVQDSIRRGSLLNRNRPKKSLFYRGVWAEPVDFDEIIVSATAIQDRKPISFFLN